MPRLPSARVTEPHPALFDPVPVVTKPSDERWTPAWLFDALGETFDLDPASPLGGGDHVPALHRYTPADDGLAQPWFGFVWCNPPFSAATPWVDRMIDHGNGLLLAPLGPDTAWCRRAVAAAVTVTPLPRLQFLGADRTAQHISFGVLLYGFGLRAAVAASRIDDTFVRPDLLRREAS